MRFEPFIVGSGPKFTLLLISSVPSRALLIAHAMTEKQNKDLIISIG